MNLKRGGIEDKSAPNRAAVMASQKKPYSKQDVKVYPAACKTRISSAADCSGITTSPACHMQACHMQARLQTRPPGGTGGPSPRGGPSAVHHASRIHLRHRASQAQGNESRLTSERAEDLQQVLWIPGGPLAPPLDGSFVGDLANQIEGEVADDGHVLGAVAGAQA